MPEYPNPKLRTVPPAPRAAATGSHLEYAELDVTSNFSFLRGASHPDELVYRAAELGHRAIAITDVNSLAGVVRAHEAAREAEMKLLIGARLQFTDAPDLLVWACDRAAYARLCRLLTLGKRRAEKGECTLHLNDFLNDNAGLLAAIVPDGAPDGASNSANNDPPSSSGLAVAPTRRSDALFSHSSRNGERSPLHLSSHVTHSGPFARLKDALADRISIATCCIYGPDDYTRLAHLADLGRAYDIPLLATNHVHYHDPARRALQDVLTCVRHACTIQQAGFRLFPHGERYLKSPEQMHRLFADYPRGLRRSLEIAERCNFSLESLRYEYPDELVPAGRSPIEYLSELAWKGAAQRYPQGVPQKVRMLVERELALIEQLKFEAYFLTVYDLVTFARSRGILCQGRGSAANSAVCYCIGVTSVDPARIDLLFERFISAARNEPPDIDIDFEHERREEVIQYVYEKYGRERSGMTAEVITYRGRSAIRDVGKAMGLNLDMVDSMAGKLDWWHSGVLDERMIRETGLDPNDRTVRLVIAVATGLLGFPRHLSQHVGGMVMTRGPLCEMVPIENASMPDRTVIEWDKDDIDSLGILKVDVLALGMLTCISKAFRLVDGIAAPAEATHALPDTSALHTTPTVHHNDFSPATSASLAVAPTRRPDAQEMTRASLLQLHTIPAEDAAVYEMVSNADTIGVFQIESRAQMSMLPRLRPQCFYDLVIEVAIVRPGPIQGDMVHPYLRRRVGEEPVTYPSEALREVLHKTLGVPLFQEQAMRLVMVGANFTGEEADRLRRAMAAWKRHKGIEGFHQKIVDGMLTNGYTTEFAEQCFNQIRGFGEYGFPESHAASFALLVYVSAWLKRHHPAAFAAALLNSQPMGFYMPAQIVRDAKEHGVEVRPADVNRSDWDCTLEPEREGHSCAAGCRGVSLNSSQTSDATPRHQEPFTSQPPSTWGHCGPAMRLGFRQLKGMREQHARRIMERRESHGRFSSVAEFHRLTDLPVSTLRLLAEADAFGSLGISRRQALWQVLKLKDEPLPLFDSVKSECNETPVRLPTMPLGQEVMTDYSTIGLSLKQHPLALVRDELSRRKILTASELQDIPHGRWVRVAGLVLIRQRPGTAAGIVFETLEDETGIVNLIVKPQIYDYYRPAARHAGLLQAEGYVQREGQIIHVLAKRLFDLSDLIRGLETRSRDFH